jgi:ElaB/YqjD/DUF883 family membrane-anchored ribosome-binding protein
MRTLREDLSPQVEREDPSRGPSYEQSESATLGSGSGGEASSGEFGTAGTREGSAGAGGAGPLDTRTDAEVTEELKAAAARKRDSSIGQRTRGAAASVSGQVGRVSQTLSRGVERMTGAVKGGGGAAYRTTKDVTQRATSAARQVPTRVGSVAQTTGTFVQENPIISGAIAVALGAALALMIPSSRRERRLIGEASDEVKSSIRQAAEEKVEQAKDLVQTAAEAATDAARNAVTGKPGEPAAASAANETTSHIDVAAGATPMASEATTGVRPTEELARRQKV